MPFEIDFLPVGEGEKSGDAIAMRFGNSADWRDQSVCIIDGGTKESGDLLVEHVKKYYQTTSVDAVFCTHSDSDHASGLTEVLAGLSVRRLFMHLPWNHLNGLDGLVKGAEMTGDRLKHHFKKSLANAHELETLARIKGIPIIEPFSDTWTTSKYIRALGPSTVFYESLLESFRCADELLKESLVHKIVAGVEKAVKWVEEAWSTETLVEPAADASSPENNSSVILSLQVGDEGFLFTSDAGVPALTQAADQASSLGIDLKSMMGLQVPHHGSKHNVGPAILDRIIGPKRLQQNPQKTVVVSSSKEGEPKHPSRRVVNAFIRRGANVFKTQGVTICHPSKDAPRRPGWSDAIPFVFFNEVEE